MSPQRRWYQKHKKYIWYHLMIDNSIQVFSQQKSSAERAVYAQLRDAFLRKAGCTSKVFVLVDILLLVVLNAVFLAEIWTSLTEHALSTMIIFLLFTVGNTLLIPFEHTSRHLFSMNLYSELLLYPMYERVVQAMQKECWVSLGLHFDGRRNIKDRCSVYTVYSWLHPLKEA